jgi:hypothetical protein
MIVDCVYGCGARFDDEFRTTICPHETFAANDGRNNFRHHHGAYLQGGNMTGKVKEEAEAVDTPDVRVHIKLMSDEKTLVINIEDLVQCSKAKRLKKKDAALLVGLNELLQDIHASNVDATALTLTPKNVEKVLGADPLDDAPSGEEEVEKTA